MDKSIILNNEDLNWININQPHILHFKENGIDILKGSLTVDALLKENQLLLYPSQNEIDMFSKTYIFDQFSIYVKFIKLTQYEIAIVKETGGRLQKTAKNKSLSLIDLHVIEVADQKLCLHGQYDLDDCLPNGFNLKDYMCNIIIPFFFSQSFYEKYNKWPLGEYAHKDIGRFQSFINKKSPDTIKKYFNLEDKRLKKYFRHLTKNNRSYKYKHKCPCGSKKRVKFCNCGFIKILDSAVYTKFFKEFKKHFPFKLAPAKFSFKNKNRYTQTIPKYLR